MSLQRYIRVSGVCITGATLLLALTRVGMCQTAPVQEVEQAPSDTLEEIIVYGQRSLLKFRLDMYRAEEDFYDLFNSLNSDDEYDVHCYREAPTGSHIRRRFCRANFEKEITAEAAVNWRLGQAYVTAGARIRHKKKLLNEEMEALLSEHPNLTKALSEFSVAKQTYESEHQRRCGGGRALFCQ